MPCTSIINFKSTTSLSYGNGLFVFGFSGRIEHLCSWYVFNPKSLFIYNLTFSSNLDSVLSLTQSGQSKSLIKALPICLKVSECFPHLHLNQAFCADFGLNSYGDFLFLSDHNSNTSGYRYPKLSNLWTLVL